MRHCLTSYREPIFWRKIVSLFLAIIFLPLLNPYASAQPNNNIITITTFSAEGNPKELKFSFVNEGNGTGWINVSTDLIPVDSSLGINVETLNYDKTYSIGNEQLKNGTFNYTSLLNDEIIISPIENIESGTENDLYDIVYDSNNNVVLISGINGYIYALENNRIYETHIENSTRIPSGDLQKKGEPATFISQGNPHQVLQISFYNGSWNITNITEIPYPPNYGGGPQCMGLMHNDTKGMIAGTYAEYPWGYWHNVFQWYENKTVTTIQDIANDIGGYDLDWLNNNSYVFVGGKYYTGTLYMYKYDPSDISNNTPILELVGPMLGYPKIGIIPDDSYAILAGTYIGRMDGTNPVGMYKYYFGNETLELIRTDSINWWDIEWSPNLINSQALITGSEGNVLLFNSQTDSFTNLPTGLETDLNAITWIDENRGYIVGNNGKILKFDLNITSGDYFSPWISPESAFQSFSMDWMNDETGEVKAYVRFNINEPWVPINPNNIIFLDHLKNKYQIKFELASDNISAPIISNISIRLSHKSTINSMELIIGDTNFKSWNNITDGYYTSSDFSALLLEMINYYKINETNTTEIPISIVVNGTGNVTLTDLSITMVIKAPDLIVFKNDLITTPEFPLKDDLINVEIKVYNSGLDTSDPCKGAFYRDVNQENKTILGSPLDIPSLEPGESHFLDINLDLSQFNIPFILYFMADLDEEIEEIDENNNLVSKEIMINQPPVVLANPNQTIFPNTTAYFYDNGSFDPDGKITRMRWILNNVEIGSEDKLDYLFESDGIYHVIYEVYDDRDAVNITTTTVFVTNPPIANAGDDQYIKAGNWITLDASRSYDPDGYLSNWIWDLKNFGLQSGRQVQLFIPDPGIYPFRLTVFDNIGGSSWDDIVVVATQTSENFIDISKRTRLIENVTIVVNDIHIHKDGIVSLNNCTLLINNKLTIDNRGFLFINNSSIVANDVEILNGGLIEFTNSNIIQVENMIIRGELLIHDSKYSVISDLVVKNNGILNAYNLEEFHSSDIEVMNSGDFIINNTGRITTQILTLQNTGDGEINNVISFYSNTTSVKNSSEFEMNDINDGYFGNVSISNSGEVNIIGDTFHMNYLDIENNGDMDLEMTDYLSIDNIDLDNFANLELSSNTIDIGPVMMSNSAIISIFNTESVLIPTLEMLDSTDIILDHVDNCFIGNATVSGLITISGGELVFGSEPIISGNGGLLFGTGGSSRTTFDSDGDGLPDIEEKTERIMKANIITGNFKSGFNLMVSPSSNDFDTLKFYHSCSKGSSAITVSGTGPTTDPQDTITITVGNNEKTWKKTITCDDKWTTQSIEISDINLFKSGKKLRFYFEDPIPILGGSGGEIPWHGGGISPYWRIAWIDLLSGSNYLRLDSNDVTSLDTGARITYGSYRSTTDPEDIDTDNDGVLDGPELGTYGSGLNEPKPFNETAFSVGKSQNIVIPVDKKSPIGRNDT